MENKFVDNSAEAKAALLQQEKLALRASAKIVKKACKDAVPVRRGVLKKNIGTWVRTNRKSGTVSLLVGVYNYRTAIKKGLHPANNIAHLVEQGTRRTKAHSFIEKPVTENIGKIREAQAQFLPDIKPVSVADIKDDDEEVE